MSEENEWWNNDAERAYYTSCPRCESRATAWIGRNDLGFFPIHKYVCQECCHVFEVMPKEAVRDKTGWVD